MRRNEFIAFLESRKGRLDGVVVSGGEPTIHSGTPDLLRDIKSLGFLTKLDTNGGNPEKTMAMTEEGLVDMLGIDYKAPASKYADIANSKIEDVAGKVRSLISFAVERGLPIDVRTTVHRKLLSFDDLAEMRRELDELGVNEWYLQQFHPVDTLEPSIAEEKTYSDGELIEIAKRLGGGTNVRGVKAPENRFGTRREAVDANSEMAATS
jgi:pyruvate formate lyase activating enzyme